MLGTMIQQLASDKGVMWQCITCQFITKKKCNLIDHVEAHHLQGYSHDCGLCGKQSKTRASHRNHKCPYATPKVQ